MLPRLPWFGPELDCRLHRNSILPLCLINRQEESYSTWRRRGDSNSCAPKVRRFSRPLGYRLPISSQWRAAWESNPADQVCSPTPSRLACDSLVGPVGLEPTIKRVLSAPRLPIPATGLNLVREERLELSRPKTLVSKTSAAAKITPLPHGRGDRIRTC